MKFLNTLDSKIWIHFIAGTYYSTKLGLKSKKKKRNAQLTKMYLRLLNSFEIFIRNVPIESTSIGQMKTTTTMLNSQWIVYKKIN